MLLVDAILLGVGAYGITEMGSGIPDRDLFSDSSYLAGYEDRIETNFNGVQPLTMQLFVRRGSDFLCMTQDNNALDECISAESVLAHAGQAYGTKATGYFDFLAAQVGGSVESKPTTLRMTLTPTSEQKDSNSTSIFPGNGSTFIDADINDMFAVH